MVSREVNYFVPFLYNEFALRISLRHSYDRSDLYGATVRSNSNSVMAPAQRDEQSSCQNLIGDSYGQTHSNSICDKPSRNRTIRVSPDNVSYNLLGGCHHVR